MTNSQMLQSKKKYVRGARETEGQTERQKHRDQQRERHTETQRKSRISKILTISESQWRA